MNASNATDSNVTGLYNITSLTFKFFGGNFTIILLFVYDGVSSANTSHLLLESESSSSDDSNEEYIYYFYAKASFYAKKQETEKVRIENYVEVVVHNYTRTQFQQNFRIPIDGFEHLLRILGPALQRRGSVTQLEEVRLQ